MRACEVSRPGKRLRLTVDWQIKGEEEGRLRRARLWFKHSIFGSNVQLESFRIQTCSSPAGTEMA